MNSPRPASAGLTPRDCVQLLVEHRRTWLRCTLVCGVLSVLYALFMPRYWEASQAVVVRSEVSGASNQEPGEFADLYEMRTFQETILELARSRHVIAATLKVVDATDEEPSLKDIEEFREHLSMLPPNGAEFGKTEVFYLAVQDTDRQRALKLVEELCQQIDFRLRELRIKQATSVMEELEQKIALAQSAHSEETSRLEEFEGVVGSDLGELRQLNAALSGQSDLRQQTVNLDSEIRVYEAKVKEALQLKQAIVGAQQNPEQLIAMPTSLLQSQPTLRSLKDGLVSAQLRAAELGGIRTASHPQLIAAQDSVEQIRRDFFKELEVALEGIEVELSLYRNRLSDLEKELQKNQARLGGLARLRADYANRISAVENSRAVLDQARTQLGEVRAMKVAARSASLVTPVDNAETGQYPVGIGRTSVVLLGSFAGLVMGLGWIFLSVPLEHSAEQWLAEGSELQARKPVRARSASDASPTSVQRPTSPPRLAPEVAAKVQEILATKTASRPAEKKTILPENRQPPLVANEAPTLYSDSVLSP